MIDTDLVAFTNGDCVVNKTWLKEITKPFDDKEVLAVAGFTSNPPKPETKLQEIIGRELEYRYNHFSKKILRAPDMNLCVRTEILKKVKFNEDLDVSYDADFGYRINKFSPIIYNSKAVVYHYHRATWKAYFKQQYRYARFVPINYLKHISKITGDNISKTFMLIQIILLYFIIFSILMTLIISNFIVLFYFTFFILVLSYLYYSLKLSKNFQDFIWFLCLFVVRNIAWCLGIIRGVFLFIQKR